MLPLVYLALQVPAEELTFLHSVADTEEKVGLEIDRDRRVEMLLELEDNQGAFAAVLLV